MHSLPSPIKASHNIGHLTDLETTGHPNALEYVQQSNNLDRKMAGWEKDVEIRAKERADKKAADMQAALAARIPKKPRNYASSGFERRPLNLRSEGRYYYPGDITIDEPYWVISPPEMIHLISDYKVPVINQPMPKGQIQTCSRPQTWKYGRNTLSVGTTIIPPDSLKLGEKI